MAQFFFNPNTWDFSGEGWSVQQIFESVQDNITTGAVQTQAGAVPLTAAACRIVTNATAGNGVILPNSVRGATITVTNAHATNAVQVYAFGTDTIDGIAGATGQSLPATKTATYVCYTPGIWHRQLSA